jgi:heme A synthase
MHIIFAFIATLVLIAFAVWQMRSKEESRGRDFAIIAIMALMIMIYYCF